MTQHSAAFSPPFQYVDIRLDVWQALLDALEEKDEAAVSRILGADEVHPRQLLVFKRWTELQEPADYRCSVDQAAAGRSNSAETSTSHFALGLPSSCHFTSPLRRYPDLVCHRLVVAMLEKKTAPYTDEEVRVTQVFGVRSRGHLSKTLGLVTKLCLEMLAHHGMNQRRCSRVKNYV